MIKEIEHSKAVHHLITSSFLEVAVTLNMTPENCPGNSAYMTEAAFMKDKTTQLLGLFDETLAGCIGIEQKSPVRYKIKYLAVDPHKRHQGYGTNLMDGAFDYIKSKGGTKVQLGMFLENESLKQWYLKQGFEMDRIQKYKQLFHICFMEKKL